MLPWGCGGGDGERARHPRRGGRRARSTEQVEGEGRVTGLGMALSGSGLLSWVALTPGPSQSDCLPEMQPHRGGGRRADTPSRTPAEDGFFLLFLPFLSAPHDSAASPSLALESRKEPILWVLLLFSSKLPQAEAAGGCGWAVAQRGRAAAPRPKSCRIFSPVLYGGGGPAAFGLRLLGHDKGLQAGGDGAETGREKQNTACWIQWHFSVFIYFFFQDIFSLTSHFLSFHHLWLLLEAGTSVLLK